MMFEKWKQQRLRRRAQSEARHLAHEARRIIKKKRYRIPDAVVSEVESAVNEVEASLKGEDHERTRQALSRLDEKMDEHLAFARKSSLREYAESIGVAVAIALLLRAFVVEAFQIPSGSMIPTLEIGDHIFVSKFSYGIGIPFTHRRLVRFGQPKRGDIIVFRFPLDPDVDYIKRVVALPGEKVEVRKNEIFINGRPMSREFIKEACRYEDGPPVDGLRHERECERWLENLDGRMHPTIHNPHGMSNDWGGLVVPEGHVFVMGDNRDNSNDSRVWGTVPQELIKGRALIVWWSRGPTNGGASLSAAKEWFSAIRWGRFFSLVE
jgi:signal peptidase I